ncbi:MAG: phytoene desaturase family protein [Microbacteriaceae bacterium]
MDNGRRVVIIGGGMGGLSAAALLAKDGRDVTLIEALPTVGGRAGMWEHKGFRFDTGPSWYLMPEVFDHFYKLMGTSADEQLDLGLLDPGYRVYFEPEPDEQHVGGSAPFVDVRAQLADNLAVFETLEPGGAKALEKYVASATDTYAVAVKYFLYSSFEKLTPLFVKPVLTRLGTLIKLLTTPIYTFASRFVRSVRARQILGYPAVFLGASPYTAPSMFHLMSHLDLNDGVLYAQGGFTRVIESIRDIATAHGATIITNARATDITVDRSGRKPRATGVTYVDNDGQQHHIAADIVVSGADLHHTETALVPDDLQTFPEEWWNTKTSGPGAVLLYLGVRGEIPQMIHHNLFFIKDWDSNFGQIFTDQPTMPDPASFYVCMPSVTDDTVAPQGDTNIFVLVPCPADPGMGRGGMDGSGDAAIEAVAERTIDAIAEWANIPDFRDRITVRRTVGPGDFKADLNAWMGSALGPAHTLMQSAMFRARNVSSTMDGLYYVGSSTIPGIGLPMCLISAEVLLKRLRGDVTPTPMPEPLTPSVTV